MALPSSGTAGYHRFEGDAQQNVDDLCQRFSHLFGLLHREEGAIRAAASDANKLEQQLQELEKEQKAIEAMTPGEASSPEEILRLRREAESAEQRATSAMGEYGAVEAAAETYRRQVTRLRQRSAEEAANEKKAAESLRRCADTLSTLQRRRSELQGELERAEANKLKLSEECQEAAHQRVKCAEECSKLEQQIEEEKSRSEQAAIEVTEMSDEITDLEHKLTVSKGELEDMVQRLERERSTGQQVEEKLREQREAHTRAEDELKLLVQELEERRQEGRNLQRSLMARSAEAERMKEKVHEEQRAYQSEQETAERTSIQLRRLRAELTSADRQRREAEAELQHLQGKAKDLEEKCRSQEQWQEEQREKHGSSKTALERLRAELSNLTSDKAQLQKAVDEVLHERTRLEVELQVAVPALQEVMKRTQGLEERLGARVRELGLESDKLHQLRKDAAATQAEVRLLERTTEQLNTRARDFAHFEGASFSPGYRRGHSATNLGAARHAQIQDPAPYASFPRPRRPSSPPPAQAAPTTSAAMITAPPAAATSATTTTMTFRPDASEPFARAPPPSSSSPAAAAANAASSAAAAAATAAATAGRSPSRMMASEPVQETQGNFTTANMARTLTSPTGLGQTTDEAVRFLCDFVAREEERLGFSQEATPGRLSGGTTGVRFAA
mmetsp:Transcript_31955/g.68036  ORF Transcript_31955/g.68036 Transcript_31955/m.68036 type:complete len:675 (+) Transcript_31955:44-2068(+)